MEGMTKRIREIELAKKIRFTCDEESYILVKSDIDECQIGTHEGADIKCITWVIEGEEVLINTIPSCIPCLLSDGKVEIID